jgi:hypothetical protein
MSDTVTTANGKAGITFKDVGKVFSDSVDKFSKSPNNNNSNSGTVTESDLKYLKMNNM